MDLVELRKDIERMRNLVKQNSEKYVKMLIQSLKDNSVEVRIVSRTMRNFIEMDFVRDLNLESEDMVITIAESAAADVGLIFFTGLENGEKTALVKHHIAILQEDSIMPDVLSAYKLALLRALEKGHGVILASSSASKTADIEGKLVWGVHGPKNFTVIIVKG